METLEKALRVRHYQVEVRGVRCLINSIMEFRRINMSSRLLLKQMSYGLLATTSLDILSDKERQGAIQALSQLFDSMTSRVMLNSVTARSLYLTDITFKNKATENKLFLQSAIQSVPSSLEETFFIFMHSSAEKKLDTSET